MQTIYETEYPVRVINTDMFGLCRTSSVMDFLQEAATEHAMQIGIGRDELTTQSRAIWMLVRLKYVLLRPLRSDEILQIKTWYRPPKGAFVLRDFDLFVNGEHVGYAISTWVLADMDTHSLLKAEEILGSGETLEGEAFTEKLGKIRMPREMEAAGERRIGYSETDINGHANNTRYADYACDAVHFEELAGHYVKALQITYSAECLSGQTIYMLQKREGDTYYVRGVDKDSKPHFDIRMEVAEI